MDDSTNFKLSNRWPILGMKDRSQLNCPDRICEVRRKSKILKIFCSRVFHKGSQSSIGTRWIEDSPGLQSTIGGPACFSRNRRFRKKILEKRFRRVCRQFPQKIVEKIKTFSMFWSLRRCRHQLKIDAGCLGPHKWGQSDFWGRSFIPLG